MLLDKAKALGADEFRNSQPWSSVEKSPGTYSFPATYDAFIGKAASLGMGTLLTFADTNSLYDGGIMPFSAEGRQAYADYIVGVLDRYGGTVRQVEVWNEFNGYNATGPLASDKAGYYTELLKVVYQTVKAVHPEVTVLGGSSNVVGIGYLESLFKRGALAYMDGVAVHPYRPTPEHVDDELAHLVDVMERYGGSKPIYATEFGNEFASAADAPDYLVKMVTMMSAANVVEGYWYGLQDQRWFANMGLYDQRGTAKPAAAAFEFAQKHLLSHGDAVQLDLGDDRTLVYRYGSDTYVMWGAPRSLSITGNATVWDSSGRMIDPPDELAMHPIIVSGDDISFTLGESPVIADSMLEYAEGGWDYFAKTADGRMHELGLVDWDWTSYMGGKWFKPLRINADTLAPAGDRANPIQAVSRYTATESGPFEIDGTWDVGFKGDGIDLHILVNGEEIYAKIFQGELDLDGLTVDLEAGDTLDFAVGPNGTVTGDSTKYHIQLLRADAGLLGL